MQKTSFLIACAALALQALAAQAHQPTTERETRFGKIVGIDDSAGTGTYAWKGVPFAKPPVGDLRWKAPVDPDKWKSTRATQQFGNACVQYGRIYGPGANNRYDPTIGTTLNQAVGSEDCLYLNIWRPADNRGDRPVIVFVHGGSNVSGYTADPVYDGAALAKAADAVVVSVNYRLGIFGFLNVPQLKSGTDAQEDSGNFALLDIIKALQFIRHDIAKFGGNPSNITLMGQSAGAINVYALLTTPATVDARPQLFHRAVPLSGGISLATNLPPGRIPTLNPASVYLLQGNQLLYNQLIADGIAADVAGAAAWVASQTPAASGGVPALEEPGGAALHAADQARRARPGRLGPDSRRRDAADRSDRRDGGRQLPARAGPGRQHARRGQAVPDVPDLCSAGRAAGSSPTSSCSTSSSPTARRAAADPIEQWIPALYLPVTTPVTGFNARTELLEPDLSRRRRDNVLDTLKSQQNDVWYYRFDWDEEPAPFNDIYGAAHVFDLPFIFGTFGPSLFSNIANSTANRPGRLALSRGDDGKRGCVRAQRRSERAGRARRDVADLARQADLRRHPDGQGHFGPIGARSNGSGSGRRGR